MTNPLNSLSKFPKRPFREKSTKSILLDSNASFALPNYSEDHTGDPELDCMIDEITTQMAEKNIYKYSKEISKQHQQTAGLSARERNFSGYVDFDLITKLISRIKQLEMAKRYQEKEIRDKNLRIKVLEDKVKLFEKFKEITNSKYENVQKLEERCEKLQNQISEMETFLGDYGLIWVGDADDVKSDFTNLEHQKEHGINNKFIVEYDKILKNIEELNFSVRSEESDIAMTAPGRLELQKKDAVSLTLYANGICFFKGPFRPFSEVSTRQVIQDFTDGYFPSELESQYPHGVPIDVTDRRNILYKAKQIKAFQGTGRMLGGESSVSRLLESSENDIKCDVDKYTQTFTETMIGDNEGSSITIEQFLNRIPQNTILRDGKIFAIRNSIRDVLNNRPINTQTAALGNKHEQNLIPNNNSELNVAHIKVRSLRGNETYHINMKSSDFIRDLYDKVNEISGLCSNEYVLISTFPSRKLIDMNLTVNSYELVPSASLFIELLNKSS